MPITKEFMPITHEFMPFTEKILQKNRCYAKNKASMPKT